MIFLRGKAYRADYASLESIISKVLEKWNKKLKKIAINVGVFFQILCVNQIKRKIFVIWGCKIDNM